MQRVKQQFEQAQHYLAGGVSSSTRVNQALKHPLLIERAEGCRVWDLDGREYIDLCCSHGATLLGHGDAGVRAAVEDVLRRGAACSYESGLHTDLARLLCETIPSLERIRFTGSGTEATMHTLRLARAFTGKNKFIRFEGNFHGYHDQVMFGSSAAPGRNQPELSPQSAGVNAELAEHIVQLPYNQPELLEAAVRQHADDLAAVICEPVFYNAGCVIPTPEFASALRHVTARHGVLLIFDEVLSAFRMGAGGAQEHLGITPDLCTLGKAVGGGYPLSVFGGRADIMQHLMPEGDCQHSGTYNAHPVAVAASLAALRTYRRPEFYPHIHHLADLLYGGLREIFGRHRVDGSVQGLGARFGIYFGVEGKVRDYTDAQQHDSRRMLEFIALAIERGVYFHDYGGVACHHGFCGATAEPDIQEALSRLDSAVAKMAK